MLGGLKVEIKLFVHPNIDGKIFEKRIVEVMNEYNFANARLEIHKNSLPESYRMYHTPTLMIDNIVVSSGKLLSKEEIDSLFRSNCFKS